MKQKSKSKPIMLFRMLTSDELSLVSGGRGEPIETVDPKKVLIESTSSLSNEVEVPGYPIPDPSDPGGDPYGGGGYGGGGSGGGRVPLAVLEPITLLLKTAADVADKVRELSRDFPTYNVGFTATAVYVNNAWSLSATFTFTAKQ